MTAVPKERFSDAEMRLMKKAADAIKDVMDGGVGYRDLLYGKWALLTSDVEGELAARENERRTMFAAPTVQLANLVRWNAARGWGFSEDDISQLEREIPPEPPPPEDGKLQLKARVLEIRLPDGPDGVPGYRRTFDELWDVVVQEQGMRPFHLFGLGPNVRLALRPGAIHGAGLDWRIIDLGNGWPERDPNCVRMCGTSPRSLPPEAERPHAGVLAAAAHFPLWLARMDGAHVPYVWLPGYELPGMPHAIGSMRERVIHHPVLTRNGPEGKMFLYYHWDHVPFETYAVPIYADAPSAPSAPEGDGEGG
jgi:hypothetical protein